MIYDSTAPYPRDLIGYGRDVPHARWPGGARIAVCWLEDVAVLPAQPPDMR